MRRSDPHQADDLGGSSGSRRRAGLTFLEILLSVLLIPLLVGGAWTVYTQHRRAALHVAGISEGLEVTRTTVWILSEELFGSRMGEDFSLENGDSLVLRAFRGAAYPLGADTTLDGLPVCFRGIRNPEPDKDSVLLLKRDGQWEPVDLVRRATGADSCHGIPGGISEVWTLEPPPTEMPVLGRVFESGVYSFSRGALRYRRGSGGRQPLTPERLESGFFSVKTPPGGRLGWTLVLKGLDGKAEDAYWEGVVW